MTNDFFLTFCGCCKFRRVIKSAMNYFCFAGKSRTTLSSVSADCNTIIKFNSCKLINGFAALARYVNADLMYNPDCIRVKAFSFKPG
jgi:hypothetical protein